MKILSYIFVLMAILINNAAFAGYEEVLNQCLNRDWRKTECRVAPSENFYIQEAYDEAFNIFMHGMSAAIEGLGKVRRRVGGLSGHMSGGEYTLSVIANKIQKLQEEQKLSDCVTSCVAICSTANLLRYEISLEGLASKFRSVNEVVESGVGVCTEYSRVGKSLYEKLGYKVELIGAVASKHAFLRIETGGVQWIVEPQNKGECVHIVPQYSEKAQKQIDWLQEKVNEFSRSK